MGLLSSHPGVNVPRYIKVYSNISKVKLARYQYYPVAIHGYYLLCLDASISIRIRFVMYIDVLFVYNFGFEYVV